ncbi:MAG TPA: type II toxin-antitoxin system RelE/ParE family toxin [Dokdonella sp.]|uniref:type II toxin-antitoxin system RelE/ParE family toxin n=1 Tax=Dokdonella sp. TaxID=2291710 RepID=UPI002D8048F2|nr:type II toxin-antitoxin system RelE/ParE family toxin [Dokdonella sp.]HET9032926.1 type II toxin-antitoxin system RelE/ParE family toxin [Dokdonella sp.]
MKIAATTNFIEWLNALADLAGRARIQARVERLAGGNPGQHRVLKGGICEMKIDVGPGYRVYYTQRGKVVVILLCGGDKTTQTKDIKTATKLAQGL